VGATNPPPELLSWQLSFIFADTAPRIPVLTPGVNRTNVVGPGEMFCYAVDVPVPALMATNRVVSATGPVSLFFNQSQLPTGTNASDYALLLNSVGGIGVPILTTNSTPRLVRGGRYYLGVYNGGTAPVTVVVRVDFLLEQEVVSESDITITRGPGGIVLEWTGPVGTKYQVEWTPSLVPATWSAFSGTVTSADGHYLFVDDGSQTGGLGPARFYRFRRLP
jgi:hypothetical protein